MRNIDVLYIHPSKFLEDRVEYCLIPVGAAGLLNTLKNEGIEVLGINYALEKSMDDQFNLESELRGIEFRTVAIDLHWFEHSYAAIEISRICKRVNPNAHVILGGFTATYFSQEILSHFPFIDVIVRGDSENPFLDTAKHLIVNQGLDDVGNITFRSRDGRIKENPISYLASTEDLDTLNFTDLTFLKNWEEYLKTDVSGFDDTRFFNKCWICVGRGCLYDCSYCGGSNTSHRRLAERDGLTLRSPEKVAEDICRLYEMGVHQVLFSHDLNLAGDRYWKKICEGVRTERVDMGCHTSFWQLSSQGFLSEFTKTFVPGLSSVEISPESGSESVRELNGKSFSNRDVLDFLDKLRQESLHVDVYFAPNLPGETEETFEETISLSKRMIKTYPDELIGFTCGPITIEPCCPMSLNPNRYEITPTLRSFMDYYTSQKQVQDTAEKIIGYRTKHLDMEDIFRLFQKWKDELGPLLTKSREMQLFL
jgi:radical SAM superfamily enzyme YgiQ (UPF0313 family)